MAAVGTLEDEAKKRKERLKALKGKRGGGDNDSEPPGKKSAGESADKLPKPVFRSYKPQDESLKEAVLTTSKPKLTEITDQVQDQLEAAKPEPVVEEVDLVNLAPRKPDWDLKRDVAKKLEKLERRTQRAIAQLIRERLQAGKEDLAAAVDANVQYNTAQEDED